MRIVLLIAFVFLTMASALATEETARLAFVGDVMLAQTERTGQLVAKG